MNAAFDWKAARAAAVAKRNTRNVVAFPVRVHREGLKHRKVPAIPKGQDWHDYSASDGELQDAANIGIVIPAGVVAIDVDEYKGVTREAIEAALGCPLDWAGALLQSTVSGGKHYVFRLPDGIEIKQGSDVLNVQGFDTRTAGKGWLCTGRGYTVREGLGDALAAMRTAAWPTLPAPAVEKLRKREPPPDLTAPAANDDGLPADLPMALSAIDPDDRDDWLHCGMALHAYGTPGWNAWCNWSRRSRKFDADDQRRTWASFHDKADGVTLGTIYQMAKDAGWQRPKRDKPELSRPVPVYHLLTGAEVRTLPALSWRIKGVLPARGLAQIFGPPASGKSFLAFDMATAIAEGRPWFGYRVNQAPTIYVALEGEGGFPQRVEAWCRSMGQPVPDGLRVVLQPLRINVAADVEALGAAVVEAVGTGAVVFVDTQNQAAPEADENASADMGRVLAGAKRLGELVEGVVVLIAHSGKDEGRGVRGHSSQRAAMDAVIRVTRDEDRREWGVDKSKDGSDGQRHGFKLETVKLGEDADGDPRTSCVIVHDDTVKARKPNAGERLALKAYVEACERGGCLVSDGGDFDGLGVDAWRDVFYELSTNDTPQGKKKAFQRARANLCEHGFMSVRGDRYRVADVKLQARGAEFVNKRKAFTEKRKNENAGA